MKTKAFLLTFLLCVSAAFSSTQPIICGWQPGEIYFVGVHSQLDGVPGFYYSSDNGENITMRDSVETTDHFGSLLADADENTIHRLFDLPYGDHLLSQDGGFTWDSVNTLISNGSRYASGVIPGEVYRRSSQSSALIDRSENYGMNYTVCSTSGFPDTLLISAIALGSDPGEVYIWSYQGDLYYSSNYAERFNFQGNLSQSAGISPQSYLVNGAESGELYTHTNGDKKIWRIYNYGANVDLIEDFPHGFGWYSGMAASREPGEIYFRVVAPGMYPGGTMEIYHTTNYGQDWTLYEHYIYYNGITSGQPQMPSSMQLQVWPNPSNPSFTIDYTLPATQPIKLGIFNLLGQQLWQCQPGIQLPGSYQIFFDGKSFPSGMYILTLQTDERTTTRKITILK